MTYAGEMYGCPDTDVITKQALYLIQSGTQIKPHDAAERPAPRLEYRRWIVDCPCGSGAGITRKGKAHCFQCGRIMVVEPWPSAEERALITGEHWQTGEPFA